MRLRFGLPLAALVVAVTLAACNGDNQAGYDLSPAIAAVSPDSGVAGDLITITGTDFYQIQSTGLQVQVCGVPLQDIQLHGEERRSVLPGGGVVSATVGDRITGVLAEIPAGTSGSVAVQLPDGRQLALEDGFSCAPAPLMAVLDASVTSGVAPLTVNFSAANSSGQGTLSYAWDFGHEGATATGVSAGYTYPEAGSYTASLTVSDATGRTASATADIMVNALPDASISLSGNTGYAPWNVQFDGSGSTGLEPLTYHWDFDDDGATADEAMPSHLFDLPGSYDVTLTVTDPAGNTDSTSVTLLVPAAPPVPGPLEAVLNVSTTSATVPATIRFDASDSTGEGAVNYAWDFGHGGATGTGVTAEYTYPDAGTYTVTLTVGDETSRTDTATAVIAVHVPLVAEFSTDVDNGPAPLTVQFDGTASSGEGALTFSWDFGPAGATGTGAAPDYTYTTTGTHTVTMTVSDETGRTATTAADITVGNLPVAEFSTDFATGDAPLTIQFDGTASTGTLPLAYHWDFGHGGTTASGSTAQYAYPGAGEYTATLTVTDAFGADSTSEVITVLAPVTVSASPALTFDKVDFNISVQGGSYDAEFSHFGHVTSLPVGDYSLRVQELARGVQWQTYSYNESMLPVGNLNFAVIEGDSAVYPVVPYVPETGSVAIAVNGVDPAPAAQYTINVLDAFVDPGTVDTSDLNALLPGVYEFTFNPILVGGVNWGPTVPMQTVVVSSGETTNLDVTYAQSGSIEFQVQWLNFTGFPPTRTVTVSGPDGFSHTFEARNNQPHTVSGLSAGEYSVISEKFVLKGVSDRAWEYQTHWVAPDENKQLSWGETSTIPLVFDYVPGWLDLQAGGLPAGIEPNYKLTPVANGLGLPNTSVIVSDLSQLVPGHYTLQMNDVVVESGPNAGTYRRSTGSLIHIQINSGAVNEVANNYYSEVQLGSIMIGSTQLPDGVEAEVSLDSIGDPALFLPPADWGTLVPGDYRVSFLGVNNEAEIEITRHNASRVTVFRHFSATAETASQTVDLGESDHRTVNADYRLAPARFNLFINGPQGAPAGTQVTITGPGGYHQVYGQSPDDLVEAPLGEYRIAVTAPAGYAAKVSHDQGSVTPDGYFLLVYSDGFATRAGPALPSSITVDIIADDSP